MLGADLMTGNGLATVLDGAKMAGWNGGSVYAVISTGAWDPVAANLEFTYGDLTEITDPGYAPIDVTNRSVAAFQENGYDYIGLFCDDLLFANTGPFAGKWLTFLAGDFSSPQAGDVGLVLADLEKGTVIDFIWPSPALRIVVNSRIGIVAMRLV